MDLDLSGKTAVVAGGSRGCGAASVKCSRRKGLQWSLPAGTRTRWPPPRPAAKAAGVVADMTTRDGALSIVLAARERFGDPDILVVDSPDAVPDRATGRQANAVKRAG